jgi:multiple sugar transport system substrate-binding protein
MKRLLAIVLVAVLLLCAVPTAFADTQLSGQLSGDLNVYYWEEYMNPIMETIIAEFNKTYPDVKVNCTQIPFDQYFVKLQTSLPAGMGPDIFLCNAPHLPYYTENNLLLDLTDLIAADAVDMTNFVSSSVEMYSSDGRQYGMPQFIDSIGLVYNKALFDEAGVAYPTDSWTWDDLLSAAQALTKDGQYGFASSSGYYAGYRQFVLQAGGDTYDENLNPTVNTPEFTKGVQFAVDLMYKYGVSPTAAQQEETSPSQLFSSGKLAMMFAGSWEPVTYYESLGDNLGCAVVPKDEEQLALSHACAWVVNANGANQTAAWAFLKQLAGKDAAIAFSDQVIPAYKGTAERWVAQLPESVNLQAFIDILDNGLAVPFPVNGINSATLDDILSEEINNIWFQSKTVEQGLNDAQAEMTAALNE